MRMLSPDRRKRLAHRYAYCSCSHKCTVVDPTLSSFYGPVAVAAYEQCLSAFLPSLCPQILRAPCGTNRFPRLTPNNFFPIFHTLAFVWLGWSETTQLRSGLSE